MIDRELITRKTEYDELDATKVYEALQTVLQDVPIYLRQVNESLDRLAS